MKLQINLTHYLHTLVLINLKILTTGDKTYKTYLKEPNKVSLIFEKVSETNVIQIINNLPNKTSCGFDGISTIVMKSIKHVILKSLTLIINRIINTGVFPDKLKIAKITPIFKKEDWTLFQTNFTITNFFQSNRKSYLYSNKRLLCGK